MTRLEKIASLYIAITGDGSPTAAELDTYASMDENISLEAISSAIMAASPLQAGYAGLSNESLVKSLFQAIFNLTTEEIDALEATEEGAAGFAYWVNEVENNPEVNLSTLAIALINGADEAGQAGIAAQQDVVDLVAAYEDYAGSTETPGSTVRLTTTAGEEIDGTSGNDTFIARILDNSNTAQSGDIINGFGGTDRLEADIGNSQNFAITLETNSVEQFAVRAQDNNDDDSSDNNMNSNVQIDAERMEGTNWYESNNSRADVVIEDVRIERVTEYSDTSDQITRDITIAMVSTDPGDVDLDVYFDVHSLQKQADNTSNSITLSVSNQVEETDYDAANPLKDIPYTNVVFEVDGETVDLELDLTSVTTYDDMWVAMQAAFAAAQAKAEYSSLLDGVTMTRSIGTDSFFSKDGVQRTADEYVLTISDGEIAPATTGWYADGGLPSTNAFGANVLVGDVTTTSNLITSTVVLDDVGRGSMGGDLVIGALSTGETSDSTGVEQFDIYVDRNSELRNITSTANTLEEVYVYNRDHFADSNDTATGSLTVTGKVDGVAADDEDGLTGASETIDAYGFNDVRVFDASAMAGSVNITAVLSENVVGKYMNLGDTAADGSADNAEFSYKLGTNDDTLKLDISGENLAKAGTTTREDFELSIMGGNGNDKITVDIIDTFTINGYANSKENANLIIDGGEGNDTITTSGEGDWIINAGSNNDTVYSDNSGDKATWSVNAANGAVAATPEQQTFTITADDADNGDETITIGAQTWVSATGTDAVVTDATAIAAAIATDLNGTDIDGDGNADTVTSAGNVVTVTYFDTGADIVQQASAVGGTTGGLAVADATSVAYVPAVAGAVDITDLDSNGAGNKGILYKAQLTVTYSGPSTALVNGANAVANDEGFESTVTIPTESYLGDQQSINQAIKDAINNDDVLNKLLKAEDGPANTLVITSLVDGTHVSEDIAITVQAATLTDLSTAEQSALQTAYQELTSNSAATLTQTIMNTTASNAQTAAAPTLYDTGSEADNMGSDNTINLGSGQDVLVLSTDTDSVETIVFKDSDIGANTIVNFIQGAATGGDKLDFTSYLTSKTSTSGSATSATTIDATLDANNVIAANEIEIQSLTAAQYNALTETSLLADLNNDTGATTLFAQTKDTTDIYGSEFKAILLVENSENDGMYKVFELTGTDTSADFTSAHLLGTVDFGDTLSLTADNIVAL
jgi:hypothetical protein